MRYSDIHGDADREAVVVLGRTRGGVPWSGSVVAYNAKGEPVWSFNGSEVGGDPRSGVTFLEATDTSVTFDIIGTGKDSGEHFRAATVTSTWPREPTASRR